MSQGPSRFGTTNLAVGATLQNGTGGGAPALVEDAAYPTSNLLLNDRKVLWSPGAAAFPLTITFDVALGSAATVSVISLHGFRLAAGTTVTKVEFFTQAGAYTPGGTWTSRGSVSGTYGLDIGAVFAGVASVASVRVVLTGVSGLLQSGKLFVGDPWFVGDSLVSDFGTREDSPQRNATVISYPSGSTFMFTLGDNARNIALQLSNLTQSQCDQLQTLADQTQPFVHLDTNWRLWDCLLVSKSVPTKQVAPTPLYTCAVNLLAIP